MNRGLISGIKQLFIPPSLGGGDAANDGALLGFDSTQPGGVKAVPAGTYVPAGGYKSGYYGGSPGAVTTVVAGTGFLQVTPFVTPQAGTVLIDRIGTSVIANGGVGSTVRLCLYASDSSGMPSLLVADYGTIDSSTNGYKEIDVTGFTTAQRTLPPGRCWLGAVPQGGSGPTLQAITNSFSEVPISSASALIGANTPGLFQGGGITGALPSPFVTTATCNGPAPRVVVRYV